jgi:hypothetical protein
MHFKSDSSGNDWGYKFTVKAHCKRSKIPPNLPFLPLHGQLTQVKMLGVVSLNHLLQSDESLIHYSFDFVDTLMNSALTPKPGSVIADCSEASASEVMLESSHPYEDNQDTYIPVTVPGAQRLIITFDAETRTENNCDYLVFYTDDSHSTRVPGTEQQYTGGKDGSSANWPVNSLSVSFDCSFFI